MGREGGGIAGEDSDWGGRFHTPGTVRLPGVGAQSEGTGEVTEDEVQGRVTGFNSSDCKKALSV